MSRSQGRQAAQYVYGNTARNLDVRRELDRENRPQLDERTRKNRDRARYMNFSYVLFLVVSMLIAGYILVGYIQVQAELTGQLETLSALERDLNNVRLKNDEKMTTINSNIDLEEIKRVAIGELGMIYAQEGQIVPYEVEGSDYVKQFMDIPK